VLEPADGSEQRNAHDIDPVLRAAQVAQKDEAPDCSSKGDQFRWSRHGRRSMFSLAVWSAPPYQPRQVSRAARLTGRRRLARATWITWNESAAGIAWWISPT